MDKGDQLDNTLSPLAKALVKDFQKESAVGGEKIKVSPLISEIATFYEQIRTAMENQDEEVLLRSAIERIIRRRMLFGEKSEAVAAKLIRELAWARYFPNNLLSEEAGREIAGRIDFYTKLNESVPKNRTLSKEDLGLWILQLMSADIAVFIKPNLEVESLTKFAFFVLKEKVVFGDNSEERDAQVYVAVRRIFAKDDLAFLRYHLFKQYFDEVSDSNLEKVAQDFPQAVSRIQKTLTHKTKNKVYTFVKRNIAPFLILYAVLNLKKHDLPEFLANNAELEKEIIRLCENNYKIIRRKIRRAIIRSTIFLLATKALFALLIEGSFERLLYGQVQWISIAFNTTLPPFLMAASFLFITTPDRQNSKKIYTQIRSLLFDPGVPTIEPVQIKQTRDKKNAKDYIFAGLWITSYVIGFGVLWSVFDFIALNTASRLTLIFFLTIVSFLIYRIREIATVYNASEQKQGLRALLSDFFVMPFVHLGRRLTLSFSRLSIFLVIFDFIIETPFKSLFAFFEDWFLFLNTQREKLE